MTVDLKLLQQEIFKLFPDLQVELEDGQIKIDHFVLNNLIIEIDNRLIFRFYKITDLQPEDVGLYLQTKMDFEKISRKYIKEDSFYLYPNDSFTSDSVGSFKKRMFLLRALKEAHIALSLLKEEVSSK
jgi:hypothetical protein